MKLYCARYVLPMDGPVIEDGAVLASGGRIAAVGTRRELKTVAPGALCVDYEEAVLLPPFANAHTHLELTNFPRWAAEVAEEAQRPESFVDWILHLIQVKRRIDLPSFLPSIRAGIAESLKSGTGSVGDILSWGPGHEAFRGSPLRGRVYLESLGRDEDLFRPRLEGSLDLASKWSAGHLQPGLSPHSPYTISAEFMEEVFAAAARKGLPVSTHLAESAAEVQFLAESRGDLVEKFFPSVGWEEAIPPARLSPVLYLDERGGLVPWNLIVHGVEVSDEDVERIARSRASVVLCPRSNAQLGVGKAPVALYLRAGVPLALGTDSRASCDSLSIWDELAFARTWFAGEVSPHDLLQMATFGGSRALGLQGEIGSLRRGWGVHFQVLRPPSLPECMELEEFLCAPGRTADLSVFFLDGRDVLQTL